MVLCEFGCGCQATHQFKISGKWCCSTSANSCAGKRAKDSAKKKGKIPQWKNGHPRGALGKPSPNKGKTYEDLYGVDKATELRELRRIYGSHSTGRCLDEIAEQTRREKISKRMKEVGGGYRQGSGRGKKGWYKGFWCDSSWELAWIIFNIDHGIIFERNTRKFVYEYNGVTRKWMPDFILSDGSFVEIKGYETEQVRAKLSSFPHDLLVLRKDDMVPYISYAVEKFGKDFTVLYEN